jgi:anthranilate synthase component 2
LSSRVPVLGVCLGHQSLGQAFGGRVVRARAIMHGKTSMIHHSGVGVFDGIPDPFEATRYHSLVVERDSLPECLEVTAWTQTPDGDFDEIMGLRHREYPVEGVQFHPESILTQHGHDLLRNFLALR